MIAPDIYTKIKGFVLAGMSGYAACRKFKEDPLKWSKQLSRDPDIVAAKAAGDIKELGRKRPDTHYTTMPWVVDVMVNGMSQTAAAAKHGKPQSYISVCVKRAKAVLARSQTTEPTPSPAAPPNPTELELDLIADMLRSAAKRLNTRPEALAHDMIGRLAGEPVKDVAIQTGIPAPTLYKHTASERAKFANKAAHTQPKPPPPTAPADPIDPMQQLQHAVKVAVAAGQTKEQILTTVLGAL